MGDDTDDLAALRATLDSRSGTGEKRNEATRRRRSHILLAEDHDDMRSLLSHSLIQQGCLVTECKDGLQLLRILDPEIGQGSVPAFDLIIADYRMPYLNALEVFSRLSGSGKLPPSILITAFGEREVHLEAERLGVAAVFDKPFEIPDLLTKVTEILDVV